MDGVGISIIETPRPLHNHDTPNSAQHTKTFYTLTCEEPVMCLPGSCGASIRARLHHIGRPAPQLHAGARPRIGRLAPAWSR